jgi:hypothetical protein
LAALAQEFTTRSRSSGWRAASHAS